MRKSDVCVSCGHDKIVMVAHCEPLNPHSFKQKNYNIKKFKKLKLDSARDSVTNVWCGFCGILYHTNSI